MRRPRVLQHKKRVCCGETGGGCVFSCAWWERVSLDPVLHCREVIVQSIASVLGAGIRWFFVSCVVMLSARSSSPLIKLVAVQAKYKCTEAPIARHPPLQALSKGACIYLKYLNKKDGTFPHQTLEWRRD